MDNGWEILSPEKEKAYQKRMKIIFKFIVFGFFPAWVILLVLGLVSH